jgi:LysR family transcriptional regulator, glycine cleavage system transcriptional activator
MKRRWALTPHINELIAFEAAARHHSFTRAAVELSLTQGSISRAVALLESRLGVSLFQRVRQQVVLTDSGRAFADEVHDVLGRMDAATRQVMSARAGDKILNLAVLPTFATQWLLPNLPGFLAGRNNVIVNFTTRLRPFLFADEKLDAAIHHGRPVWPGASLEHLMDETMLPMCSPGYRVRQRIESPRDLRRATLIHQSTRPRAWAQWHEAVGLPVGQAFRGPTYDQFAMAAAAAASDLGVALLPRFLMQQQVEVGRLEPLFELPLQTSSAYYVVLPDHGVKSIAREFADWVIARLRC